MSKPGKNLEILISELENALSTNASTEITLNHKLTDSEGIAREIDVFIELISNRKKLAYAFECKEYGGNTYVNVHDIDVFYSKIKNHGVKGIFLTTNKYRENAIKKAEKLGIELYVIEESEGFVLNNYTILQKRHQLLKSRLLVGQSDANSIHEIDTNYVYVGKELKKWKASNWHNHYLKPVLEDNFLENTDKLYDDFFEMKENSFTWQVMRPKEYRMRCDAVLLFYKSENGYIPIKSIECDFALWIETTEVQNPKTQKYKSVTSGETFADFTAQKIEWENERKSIVSLLKIPSQHELILHHKDAKPLKSKYYRKAEFIRLDKR